MSDPKDTLYRQITLLRLIPRSPNRISTTALIEKLKERGFDVTLRSLQRDLSDRLSLYFPLICHDEVKPYQWCFDKDANYNLPDLDIPSALALYLAEQQLRGLLPPTVADQLNPQFAAAHQHLENLNHNSLGRWAKRVRALPNGKTLIPARIEENIWRSVTEALLESRCLRVDYLSRKKEELKDFTLHPAGIVTQQSSSYLVAKVDGYDDLRQFALHRIKEVEVTHQPAEIDPDFAIDDYIQQGAFARQQSPEPVKLIADIHPHLAWRLKETPLSTEQKITPLEGDSDWFRLEALVPDDQDTVWWIYSLSTGIRVHAPEAWVQDLKTRFQELNAWYGHHQ